MHITTGVRTALACAGAAVIITGSTPAAAAGTGPTTALVNVATDGTVGDSGVGGSSISADGRYVAFASGSANLAPGDTNDKTDIFVRDTVAGTTTLVSGGIDGEPADDWAQYYASISADGRYVAFSSYATNLVAGDHNNERDVFVHDRQIGTTTRASLFTGDVEIRGSSDGATISGDGRYVTFIASAGNIPVEGQPGVHFAGQQAFVRDTVAGTTSRVSIQADGGLDQYTYQSIISANGKHVAFSASGGMTGDGDGSGIFVRNLRKGTTVRASVPSTGEGLPDATNPSISANGTTVTFDSYYPFVASDTNQMTDVYVRDLTAGTTTLVSANPAGTSADSHSESGRISGSGRYVAFSSQATDVTPTDTNGPITDVFLRDLRTGTTTLVSATTTGASADSYSYSATPSANGSRVVFVSNATDLAPVGQNGANNLFLRCLRQC